MRMTLLAVMVAAMLGVVALGCGKQTPAPERVDQPALQEPAPAAGVTEAGEGLPTKEEGSAAQEGALTKEEGSAAK